MKVPGTRLGQQGETQNRGPCWRLREWEYRPFPVAKLNENLADMGGFAVRRWWAAVGPKKRRRIRFVGFGAVHIRLWISSRQLPRPRERGRGSVHLNAESATATLNFWFVRSMRVRLFCESSATQPRRRNPAGAAPSRTNTMVIVPYSGRLGSLTSTLTTSSLLVGRTLAYLVRSRSGSSSAPSGEFFTGQRWTCFTS